MRRIEQKIDWERNEYWERREGRGERMEDEKSII
jgi:hypothetical protein